jgi:cation transport ATPase
LTAGAARPSVRAYPGAVEVTDDQVFGPGGETLARRFARQVLAFDEVQSLALDPARARATLNYRLATGEPDSFLTRLANAVGAPEAGVNETALPHWTDGEPVVLHRHSSVISIFAELDIQNGQLSARHPTLEINQAIARRVENALRVVPGVIEIGAIAGLHVRFDPHAVAALELLRIAEFEIFQHPGEATVPASRPVTFGLENIMVGVAAVGEFVLPLVAPVASGLLVLASLGTFGAAASQLHERRIGLPLLYSCAVGARLSSGQFLAASLISWFFRYWEHRYQQDVEVETQGLVDEITALPGQAHVPTADGLVRQVPRAEVATGEQVRAVAGEQIPVDGRVLSGAALVDESFFGGPSGPVRRIAGDQVFAGSRLLAGALDIETLRSGNDTRAARIAQTLIETTVPRRRAEALNPDAEDFAVQAVAPTLLTAGAGLIVGGMTTAGTILSPDYATGIGLAMPLEKVRDVRSAIRNGAVIRSDGAFERLAKTSWVVLDEHEALHQSSCEVVEVRSKRLDEGRLLPVMAAAGIWLGDERGPALARACRDRGFVIRRGALREIDGDGAVIGLGKHLVRLRGRPIAAGAPPPPLIVEVDGLQVAEARFVRNGYLEAAHAVRRLQADGLRVFLVSQRAASDLAKALGVDRYGEGMSDDDKVRVLRGLRRQGLGAVYVGYKSAHAAVVREAHVSISLGGADAAAVVGAELGHSDILLMSPSIAPLPVLYALARDSGRRKDRARYAVMVPNLLCVAGAFAFGFTPIAAVLLSNFGTSLAYNGAKRALHRTAGARRNSGWYADGGQAPGRSFIPSTEDAEVRTGG